MALPSVRLILNGKKAGLAPVRAAVAQTRERGVNVDVRVTWEAGEAARFAREAVEDETDVVVAGGGDR